MPYGGHSFGDSALQDIQNIFDLGTRVRAQSLCHRVNWCKRMRAGAISFGATQQSTALASIAFDTPPFLRSAMQSAVERIMILQLWQCLARSSRHRQPAHVQRRVPSCRMACGLAAEAGACVYAFSLPVRCGANPKEDI
eukprot:172263-Amphidinium_carterae.1